MCIRDRQNAVSAIVFWRKNYYTILHDWRNRLVDAELHIQMIMDRKDLNVRSCSYLMSELPKLDEYLRAYFVVVASLHVACELQRDGFTDELMDVLVMILGKSLDTRSSRHRYSSVLSLNTAVRLMKDVANFKPNTTVQLIEIELSKAFLHRALRCEDSDSDSMYCLANVYLAALYYSTGQYQRAVDHCTLVMRSQDHSQCSSHTVSYTHLTLPTNREV